MSTEATPPMSDHVRIENGTIAPPPTPEQEKIVEVPEEIQKIVEELRNLRTGYRKFSGQYRPAYGLKRN